MTLNAVNGTTQVSGTISAAGRQAGEQGGSVAVLGTNVSLLSGSVIDASGDAGGGYVKVGGDFHGASTTPTARTTTIAGGAIIDATALTNGNGGKVAVWSDGQTDFSGSILARGGAQSGNGGYVETSGHDLRATGEVSAGSAYGSAGTWLLARPISSSVRPAALAPVAPVANTIGTSLSGGTNVTITTTGSITLHNSATITDSGGNATLDFEAGTDITLGTNAAITASGGGKLNVTFDADTAGSGGGILLNSSSSITTNGGNIVMGGQGSPATAAAVGDATNSSGIELASGAQLQAGGGNISLIGTAYSGAANDGVDVYGSAIIQTAGSGTIALTGTGSGQSTSVGIWNDVGNITAVNGNITITGTGTGSNGNNSGVDIDAGGVVTSTGSGAITIVGNAVSGTAGIITFSTGNAIGGSSASGKITLQTDNISLAAGTSIQTTGNVLFEPYTTTTAVNVANGTSGLAITSGILGSVTAGSITIGNANDTGPLTVGAYSSWNCAGDVPDEEHRQHQRHGRPDGHRQRSVHVHGRAGKPVRQHHHGKPNHHLQPGGDAGAERYHRRRQRHGNVWHGQRRLQPHRQCRNLRLQRRMGRLHAAGGCLPYLHERPEPARHQRRLDLRPDHRGHLRPDLYRPAYRLEGRYAGNAGRLCATSSTATTPTAPIPSISPAE